jgi:hypothetical protein
MGVNPALLDRAIRRGRQAMNGLYTDVCLIERTVDLPLGDMDPDTMEYPTATRAVVYHGPARMQVKADINSNVVETTAGDREWTYLTSQLQLPVEASEVAWFGELVGDPALVLVDDIVTWEVAPYDSSLLGREFNLAGPYHKSQAVYRRFRVREPMV